MTIVVTGANGFIGRALVRALTSQGVHTRACLRAGRSLPEIDNRFSEICTVGTLSDKMDWSVILNGAEAVIHTAALVHNMRRQDPQILAEYRKINVDATLELARQAAKAGVRRFVFLSSIKVNGEATEPNQPFHADSPPNPTDAYSWSKFEAEQALIALARETGLELTIIRPPLVYGPAVKANLAALIRAVDSGIPLPLGAIKHNRRSFVSLANLVDLLIKVVDNPNAANQIFLVSDGEDLSTAELLRRVAVALQKPLRLIPVPKQLLFLAARAVGKQAATQRLIGSLAVDIRKTKNLIGWSPPQTVEQGLQETVDTVIASRDL